MTSDTIAIIVAVLPDQKMIAKAKRVNALMLENYPEGFALDERHVPHITLLQAFVSRHGLDEVSRSIERIEADGELEAQGFGFHDGGKLGAAGFVISRPPWLLDAHRKVVAAIAPLALPEGESDSFVTSPDEPSVGTQTIEYVKNYLETKAGDNYQPHLSVGIARTDFLRQCQGAEFEKFTFNTEGLAVYQLGNFGTCQRLLCRQKPRAKK